MNKVPRNALILGLAGLMPFVAAALCVLILEPWAHPMVRFAAQVYAVVILSFLGGVHWGLAMAAGPAGTQGPRLFWSVMPSLIAWPALFLPPVYSMGRGELDISSHWQNFIDGVRSRAVPRCGVDQRSM